MQKLPVKLYTAAQAREFDRIAIDNFGIPGFELMSRAGIAVFQLLQQRWPKATSIAIFCGAGNNAGDGYIVAKLALERGLTVHVLSVVDTALLKGDAQSAYQAFIDAQGQVESYQTGQAVNVDVIVDALLGTGLDRVVSGVYGNAINTINDSGAAVLAVDIPSGLHADTGVVMGSSVRADATISFIALKQGLFTGQAADYCGEISYASLAVPEQVFADVTPSSTLITAQPWPRRQRCSHKGSYGHVLVIGGEQGFSGAVRLAGEGALRVGAGLVTIATRAAHAGFINLTRPELMVHGIEHAEQLTTLLAKVDVIVIGPGLGQSDWAKSLFNTVLTADLPMVVDADALNLLAMTPLRKQHWVLTPHPGEAARLMACSNLTIRQDRFKAVSTIQREYGGIAVLKGNGTVIASAHEIAIARTGNPGMASGGMGDVLSGVIAGLVAQGWSLLDAAQQGVYVHGLAADSAAAQQGERGLLAGDLMAHLRQLVNQ
ncbi:MAG: NAD(P)H-hydrate dehydratase [Methylococcales bacterium]